MTNEQASKWIDSLIVTMKKETSGDNADPPYVDEVYIALSMAKGALEYVDMRCHGNWVDMPYDDWLELFINEYELRKAVSHIRSEIVDNRDCVSMKYRQDDTLSLTDKCKLTEDRDVFNKCLQIIDKYTKHIKES